MNKETHKGPGLFEALIAHFKINNDFFPNNRIVIF